MARRLRILVYSSNFPSRQAPIRGIYHLYIARALARHADVRVVCPIAWRMRVSSPQEWLLPVRDDSRGLTVDYPTYVPLSRVAARLNPHAMELATRLTTDRVRQEFPYDAIFAIWGYPDAVAAQVIARRVGCPVVTNLIGSDLNDLAFRPALRPMITDALKASNSVLVLSQAMAARTAELGVRPERIRLQYNGVNQQQFRLRDRQACRAELKLPGDAPIVVYVGNIEHVKGTDVLVDACKQLQGQTEARPQVYIIGTGSQVEATQGRIRDLGLEGMVRMMGRRLHDEVPLWIGAADLLCLPSRNEGCPNVVLEALASGRPVVGTRVGGVPELLDDSRGVVVPPEDPRALAAGLAEVLANRWDPEAISRSVAGYTWEAFGDNLSEILREAVEEGPLGRRRPPLARLLPWEY